MVFHIARTFNIIRLIRAPLEFMEDCAMGLGEHLRENVKTSAVSHTENDFFHTKSTTALDDLFKSRNKRFTAIKAETLCSFILCIQKLFETLGFYEFMNNSLFTFRRERYPIVRALDTFLNPAFFCRIGNMHEFDTDCVAIGVFQYFQHLRDCCIFKPENIVDKYLAIIVSRCETIGLRRQFVIIFRCFTQL